MQKTQTNNPSGFFKPLQGNVFYFDLQGYRRIKELTELLLSLGAIVENFFSKDIHYVITRKAIENDEHNLESPTPSPANIQTGIDGSLKVKTRADMLLEKVRLDARGKSDVIQVARQWGVKVLHLQKLLLWIKRVKSVIDKSSEPEIKETSEETSDCQVIPLKTPFFKIETFTRQYRPIYWQPTEWPDLYLGKHHNGSPFIQKPKIEKSKPMRKRESRKKVEMPVLNKEPKMVVCAPKQPEPKKVVKKAGYCEICAVSYSDLDKHLVGEVHRNKTVNSNIFEKLDSLINENTFLQSLPKSSKNTANPREQACKTQQGPSTSTPLPPAPRKVPCKTPTFDGNNSTTIPMDSAIKEFTPNSSNRAGGVKLQACARSLFSVAPNNHYQTTAAAEESGYQSNISTVTLGTTPFKAPASEDTFSSQNTPLNLTTNKKSGEVEVRKNVPKKRESSPVMEARSKKCVSFASENINHFSSLKIRNPVVVLQPIENTFRFTNNGVVTRLSTPPRNPVSILKQRKNNAQRNRNIETVILSSSNDSHCQSAGGSLEL